MRTSRFRPRSAALALALATLACSSRAAQKLIDPRLREAGELIEREGRAHEGVYGAYRVVGVEQRERGGAADSPLGADELGRTRPSQEIALDFELVGGSASWRTSCVGQRRQPPDHDFAAVADELRDEIALRCELEPIALESEGSGASSSEAGPGSGPWVLSLDGRLADNLVGELRQADQRRAVEVVMWHRLWNISRRHLPASLVSVRSVDGSESDAALIMTAREQIVLRSSLDARERGLLLAASLAVRLTPLGFDD